MNQNGSLEIILGPMFSGKSTRLNWQLNDLFDKGFSVIKIVHKFDQERKESLHTSATFELNKEIKVVYSQTLLDLEVDKYDFIAVDESQFFQDLKEAVLIWLDKKKNIKLYGLDGDFRRMPFIGLLELIPYADKIKKLNAFCDFCLLEGTRGVKAIFSRKLSNTEERIEIGGKDKYKASCRKHYNLPL
jgi:thymidine kinase